MSAPPDGYAALQKLHPACVLLKEGGVPAVLLQKFSFRAANIDVTMDLLLYPSAHSGYTTRLFFERQIAGTASNWNQHRVAEREWWAPSWQNVQASLPWPAMLCAHLRAVA
ncbi:MAG: hypothetical protein J0I81_12250 [Hyphomicrobium sp.]|nr:hypothetical protein [Hyphomicrobium sp.]